MNSSIKRIIAAIEQDPRILANKDTLEKHPGRSEEELAMLGLRKADLIRLEIAGMAIRARYFDTSDQTWQTSGRFLFKRKRGTPRVRRQIQPPEGSSAWLEYIKKKAKPGFSGGHKVRWILIDGGELV